MTKPKHLTLILSAVGILLLVAGTWAITVRAKGAETATPEPTAVYTDQPEMLGEPVSVEQEEAIKAVIDAYFGLRYRARNTLQLEGFEELVADGEDARAFLEAELGKLAVELKFAELHQGRYVDFQYSLDFQDIVFDPAAQTATVLVKESSEVILEITAEHEPENPTVSRISGPKHTVTLRQEVGQWKIVSDDYTDYVWRGLRDTGITAEEMIEDIEESITPGPTSDSVETEDVLTLPDDASTHAYDRNSAVSYALAHALDYNPDYPQYNGLGGDCTNFVSQAIYEGGNASMEIPTPLPTPSNDGQNGWYLLGDMQRASAWNDVGKFYEFVVDQYWYPTEGPEGGYVNNPRELMLGDVIQYRRDNIDTIWDHSAIVVDFDATGDPMVASHSDDIQRIHYASITHVEMRYIHIERSDGYPPIKAEISQSSDDASTNPSSCEFSNPNNEVYLGACFSGGNITSGFRFNNIQIPKNALLKYAVLKSTVDGHYQVAFNVDIYGEDSGHAATFSVTNPPENRPLVNPTTPVPWSIAGDWYVGWRWATPDIAPIIQSIIDGQNWVSGNSLAVILKNNNASTDHRRVIAFERASFDPNLSATQLIAAYDLNSCFATTVTSSGAQDGWILESAETSGTGGTTNSKAGTLFVGDNAVNKQYRSFLHFDTAPLPDTAIVTSAALKIRQQSIVGTNPLTTHGELVADIIQPYFGTTASLAKGDFEAAPGLAGIATFDPAPVDSWYTATLNSAGFGHINLTGTTQFRFSFTLDDNDDLDADVLTISSGDDASEALRPQLIVNYCSP